MPVDFATLSRQLTSDLELDTPPVQISYLESPPSGVGERRGSAPSVCTFFSEGWNRAFYAGIKAHEECEIGAFVMGIPPEGELGSRLMATIGMMQKEGYLAPGEEGTLPHNPTAPKFVAYGPLGSLEAPPTNVLIFARPKSAMLAMEASSGFQTTVTGRPMCAMVPMLNQGQAVAFSFGCIGSRVYTSMRDDQMLVGIRGDRLVEFAEKVHRIRNANEQVGAEDARRKAENAARNRPE